MQTSAVSLLCQHFWSSLHNALYVPQCGACDISMNTREDHALCDACVAATVCNDGVRCRRCDAPGPALCARCATCAPPYAQLRAPLLYGGSTAILLRRAKFQNRPELATALAQALILDEIARALTRQAHMLVPVPLGRTRRRERGYNQSVLMAQAVGRHCGVPVRHVLRRVRDTRPQSDLPLAERSANVRQAFAPTQDLTGTAVLIDDVVTSGETVFQAAWALQQAGIRHVTVLAVARAASPTWNEKPYD